MITDEAIKILKDGAKRNGKSLPASDEEIKEMMQAMFEGRVFFLVKSRVIYDRVQKMIHYFEIPAFLPFER